MLLVLSSEEKEDYWKQDLLSSDTDARLIK